jgi:hypothetical protein
MATITHGITPPKERVDSALVSDDAQLTAADAKTQKVSKSFFSSLFSFVRKALVVVTFPVWLPLVWIASKISDILVRPTPQALDPFEKVIEDLGLSQ